MEATENDADGAEIPNLWEELSRLRSAIDRIHWLNGRNRYHQERVQSYITQTECAVDEVESSLCNLMEYLELELYPHVSHGSTSDRDLNTADGGFIPDGDPNVNGGFDIGTPDNAITEDDVRQAGPQAEHRPARVPTPEGFYNDEGLYDDEEFDELARTVNLTPGGGHVLSLPNDCDDGDTSNILGPVLLGQTSGIATDVVTSVA
ncbi:hypothetical protein V5O48_013294 [Marasmius crinis-equi]|uniref:Uncharacterized protein n=1 Tax=Marasmius crinis-equi TaxID=585013 RepID=A0ABR3F0H5_9AGAR